MVFSSIYFLFYFLPFFFICYFIAPQKLKNIVALAFSCFFYAWGAPKFFFFVLAGLFIDFYLVRQIDRSEPKLAKIFLGILIGLNVALLIVFKYADFFILNVNSLLGALSIGGIPLMKLALPIGISFITFQKLSYALDVYRGVSKAQSNLANYALYIMLFPQLIAGPIVRYREVAEQITDRQAFENIDHKLQGFFRFVLGLAKKVLIANSMAAVVDQIFQQSPEQLGPGLAWLGIIAYSFQIYYDFAGYSDMAIGIARMIGFRFPENFNFPYIAENITEFWRRWHITLGSWMRDYLYIPLGGNRVSTGRLYFNLWVVFLISGLWHGAAWTFIIWGAFHGLFLVLDRLGWRDFSLRLGRIPRILITYFLVLIGWVWFRAPTPGFGWKYIQAMFGAGSGSFGMEISVKFRVLFIIALLFAFSGLWKGWEKRLGMWANWNPRLSIIGGQSILAVILAWLALAEVFATDFQPFIYFRF